MEKKKILNEDTDIQILLPDSARTSYELPDPELLQYYRDYDNRIIWALGEVNDNAYDWFSRIMDYNREDLGKSIDERKPIKFIISNYGGSLEGAKMMAEVIRLSKTPIYGLAIGMCASAASVIFLSCHKRYAMKNVTLLLHQGSADNIGGDYSKIKQFMESYQKDIDALTEFYKSHTTFDADLIEDKLAKGDWYLYEKDCLEHGLVDEIIDDIEVLL